MLENEMGNVTPTNETEVVEPKEEQKVFVLDDGSQGSRSAYIRQEFKKDRSRGDIAKELGISYSLVYTATTNMFNAVHKEGATGTPNRGTMIEVEDADGSKRVISRAEYMREQVRKGVSRTALMKQFNVPYATVYAATKDEDVPETAKGGKHMVETLNDAGEIVNVSRAEYCRIEFAKNRDRREIANELGCDYAVVWAATKGMDNEKSLAAKAERAAAQAAANEATATTEADDNAAAALDAELN